MIQMNSSGVSIKVRVCMMAKTNLLSLQNYPNIKKMFIRFNTSLCPSSLVEILFSLADFFHYPVRGSVSDTFFQKLILLKGNNSFIESNIVQFLYLKSKKYSL